MRRRQIRSRARVKGLVRMVARFRRIVAVPGRIRPLARAIPAVLCSWLGVGLALSFAVRPAAEQVWSDRYS